ncbi:MAG: type II toxin-antitoxin system VapC family toxin [Thermoanaerobaculia bacterium]|nr:type II toxin-antitoxin system VapC family toxin [Thermoanaerobaculia bacterium]
MDRCLLDTDIFSEVLKGIDQNVVAKAAAYRARFGIYTISTVTVMEVVKGFHKVGREQKIEEFLSRLPALELLTLDTRSAELAGRIYADLERTGQTIGRADPQIAGIALRHDLRLVTGNLSHYHRIQELGYELSLENWRAS